MIEHFDPDDYLTVPADYERPRQPAAGGCPCGQMDVCVCGGIGLHHHETFEGLDDA